jgi:hypothetical protein
LLLVAGEGRGKSLERNEGGAPYSTERVGTEPGPAGTELGPAGEWEGVMDELAGLGAVRASGVWLKSSLQMGELALYISFSRILRNLDHVRETIKFDLGSVIAKVKQTSTLLYMRTQFFNP